MIKGKLRSKIGAVWAGGIALNQAHARVIEERFGGSVLRGKSNT